MSKDSNKKKEAESSNSPKRDQWMKTVIIWKQLIEKEGLINITGQKRPTKVIFLTGKQRELLKNKLNKKDKKD